MFVPDQIGIALVNNSKIITDVSVSDTCQISLSGFYQKYILDQCTPVVYQVSLEYLMVSRVRLLQTVPQDTDHNI